MDWNEEEDDDGDTLESHEVGCLNEKNCTESDEWSEDERSLTESDRDWSNEGSVDWSEEEEEDNQEMCVAKCYTEEDPID